MDLKIAFSQGEHKPVTPYARPLWNAKMHRVHVQEKRNPRRSPRGQKEDLNPQVQRSRRSDHQGQRQGQEEQGHRPYEKPCVVFLFGSLGAAN